MNDTSRAYLILLFMPLFFSSNMILGRLTLDVAHPWTLAFLRWCIAVLILLPFVWKSLADHAAEIFAHWHTFLLLGLLGMWVSGALVYLALVFTTATNGTLIYTSSPVIIILIDALLKRQRIPLRSAIGVSLAIFGVGLIVLKGDWTRLVTLSFNAGDLLFVVAATSWAIYSLVLRRTEVAALPNSVAFVAIALFGTSTLLPFSMIEIVETGRLPMTLVQWSGVLGLAIFPSVLAFSSYQYGVKAIGPGITSIFLYLLPVYGVAMAVLFLGEELAWYHFAGGLPVIAGVAVATVPKDLLSRLSRSSKADANNASQ